MKIRVCCVGRIRDRNTKSACEELLLRLAPYRVELIEIKDSKTDAEYEAIKSQVKAGDYVIALDAAGKQLSSEEFSEFLSKTDRNIAFVIGGPEGLSKKLLTEADERLSLSRMTFVHETARLMLLEQIYRAFMIKENRPYNK
jgi:23S rRNA (pseudouridine1915-N3)-methyltransferase